MSRSIPLNDELALELSSAAGYWDQGGSGQTGFAHRSVTLALPLQINCNLNITPYVGYIDSNQGGPTHAGASLGGGNGFVGSHTGTNGVGTSPDDQWFGGVSVGWSFYCLLYTSPSPRDQRGSRMPSSA